MYAPRKVFQYYIHSFGTYLLQPEAKEDSAAANSFLELLGDREKKDPGSVKEIYSSLTEYVDFVADNQNYFDADKDIYGDFLDKRAAILALVE